MVFNLGFIGGRKGKDRFGFVYVVGWGYGRDGES